MAQVAVFNYRWEYFDFQEADIFKCTSTGKYTEESVQQKAETMPDQKHQIIPETKEMVEESLVADGRYRPELAQG